MFVGPGPASFWLAATIPLIGTMLDSSKGSETTLAVLRGRSRRESLHRQTKRLRGGIAVMVRAALRRDNDQPIRPTTIWHLKRTAARWEDVSECRRVRIPDTDKWGWHIRYGLSSMPRQSAQCAPFASKGANPHLVNVGTTQSIVQSVPRPKGSFGDFPIHKSRSPQGLRL